MGLLSRLFGSRDPADRPREQVAIVVREEAAADGDELVEIEVVGESYRQEAIERIAGPKAPEGKQTPVGVTFRCEPTNEHDRNAIRVEVLGQLVGYVARDVAERLSPALLRQAGGALEGRGLVVGGWREANSEGSYGVRAWITVEEATRLGLAPDPPLVHPRPYENLQPYPALAEPTKDEERLTPSGHGSFTEVPTAVTVTCEEHYQHTIIASRPEAWTGSSWPVLVDLVVAPNPHAKSDAPMVEVRIGSAPVGYFTAAMSERHRPTIDAVVGRGLRATANASVHPGKKRGAEFWRVNVALRMPDGTEVEMIPTRIVNIRTETSHFMGEQLPNGDWRAKCGTVVAAAEARILCYTRPSGLVVDLDTKMVATSHYSSCGRC
jgi:hypothetical protein